MLSHRTSGHASLRSFSSKEASMAGAHASTTFWDPRQIFSNDTLTFSIHQTILSWSYPGLAFPVSRVLTLVKGPGLA